MHVIYIAPRSFIFRASVSFLKFVTFLFLQQKQTPITQTKKRVTVSVSVHWQMQILLFMHSTILYIYTPKNLVHYHKYTKDTISPIYIYLNLTMYLSQARSMAIYRHLIIPIPSKIWMRKKNLFLTKLIYQNF